MSDIYFQGPHHMTHSGFTAIVFATLGLSFSTSVNGQELQISDAYEYCDVRRDFSDGGSALSAKVTTILPNGETGEAHIYTALNPSPDLLEKAPGATSQMRQTMPVTNSSGKDFQTYVQGVFILKSSWHNPDNAESPPWLVEYEYASQELMKQPSKEISEWDFKPGVGLRYQFKVPDNETTRLDIFNFEEAVDLVNNAQDRARAGRCSLGAIIMQKRTLILDSLPKLPEGIHVVSLERFAVIERSLVVPLSRDTITSDGLPGGSFEYQVEVNYTFAD